MAPFLLSGCRLLNSAFHHRTTALHIGAACALLILLGIGSAQAQEQAHTHGHNEAQFDAHAAAHSDCQPSEHELTDIFAYLGNVDCTISHSTGYSSGTPFPIEVVHIGTKAVEKDTANAFLVMQEAAANDGVNIGINSGFRTYEEQDYFYGCYINCNCNNCNLAAPPGYSNHNSGHALDLNTSAPGVYNWLAANGAYYGFERTVPSEDWHWEWWGGGPGGGVCGFEQLDCQSIPADGRVLEENDDCVLAGGDSRYWRRVDAGHGGSLMWTKATDSDAPSNFAAWKLEFAEAGSYELLVYTDAGEYAQSAQAAYQITHNSLKSTVLLNQQAGEGWQSLGVFDFDTSEGQELRLNDNTGEPWADDPGGTRLMVDALTIRPADNDDGDGGGDDDVDDVDPFGGDGDLAGGCSSSGKGAPLQAGLLGLVLLVAFRVRRRAQASI